ncbi:phosphoglucosamine mutase [bacterium]|nr:phosphoglucosamine mutase [bacterium]
MPGYFGTDGVRGVANQLLTPELAVRLARAHGHWLFKQYGRCQVLIGADTRVSSNMLECAYAAGLASSGIDSVLVGVIPTPGVAWLTQQGAYRGGVMISASHNPVPDNGIKLFGEDGFKLNDEVSRQLEAWMEQELPRPTGTEVGRVDWDNQGKQAYLGHLKALCPEGLGGLKVVLDCAHGAACELAPRLFRELGAEVVELHSQPDGARINVKCGSTHLKGLAEAVLEHGAAVGIAFDGDADRCLGVDEKGQTVDGDRMLLMFGRMLQGRQELPGKEIVATVMSNFGLEVALRDLGIGLVRANVGDRYVLEEMQKRGCPLGGEQSGHLIFLQHCTTGDGLLCGLRLAQYLKLRGAALSALVGEFPALPQKLVNVPATRKERLDDDATIRGAIEKVATQLGERGRLLVRPSGTEPLVRLMAEGPSESELDQLLEDLRVVVAERLN